MSAFSTFKYFTVNTLTNEVIDELEFFNVSFGRALNTSGSFSGSLAMRNKRSKNRSIIHSTAPVSSSLYIDCNGTLVWGGILWNRRYDYANKQLTCDGKEFFSYFHRRTINADKDYSGLDQLFAVQDLINYAQSFPNGDIGINVGTETSSVLLGTPFKYRHLERKVIGQEIQLLAEQRGDPSEPNPPGFDYTIQVVYDNVGVPKKFLRLNYPQKGIEDPETIFELPGNIQSYQFPEDGTSQANQVHAIRYRD